MTATPPPYDAATFPAQGRLDDFALDALFRTARTANSFIPHSVPASLIEEAYDLARMGPTSMNSQPMRLVMLATSAAKERLVPALHHGNVEKTWQAPVTLIVAYDTRFYENMPILFPHLPDALDMFANDAVLAEETAFRNATLQGAYLNLALRSVGLDVGSMSGFDRAAVNAEFFSDGRLRANWLMNVGIANPEAVFPRGKRLAFHDATQVL